MNHTYRLAWSEAGQCRVPVPETARRRGKRSGVKPLVAALFAIFANSAHALPAGGTVAAGSGSIAQSGATMTVNQSSQSLAVNWQSFNIGAAERVNFVQPNASAIALNRVLGSDPSQVLGQINANGQVWILNPNGLLFGSSAQVNVGGLVASTLGISDADFLAGKRSFSGSGGAATNQGAINANYVALLGGQVSNEGVITAQFGTVALAAGNRITLDFNGDKLLNVQVEQGALDALAQNKQLIRADGGTVLMTAQAADALASAAVNNTGVVEARSIENHNGVIKLLGDMRVGTVNVGGTLDASAPSPSIPLPQAGEGQGRGGFIETSAAHVKIADDVKITTAAPAGRSGNWLIDPYDFTIAASGGDITGAALTAALLAGAVTIQTAAGSVACTGATCGAGNAAGNGDIFVNSAVSWSANKLTLTAHRNININANLNGSGTASLALEYGQGGGGGNYSLGNGAKVSLPAGVNFSTKNGAAAAINWTVITSLGAENSVTGTDLQGMYGTGAANTANLAGNYVLGADIDASATSGWAGGFNSVGYYRISDVNSKEFTGKFDGLGHTISNLSINRTDGSFGLFGWTKNALLQNVGLLNVAISGGSNGSTGALVGRADAGTIIRNTYVDGGSVYSSTQTVGGLVGAAMATSAISYSYANVSVSAGLGGGSSNAWAGGLVGINNGAISYSYATGSVSAPVGDAAANEIGGLVGRQNAGGISNSYATGAVSGNNTLGGLVGNKTGGSITGSYWDKTTTGQATSSGSNPTSGLSTAEWSTLGPFSSSPSDGAWSTADWGAGNPYPGIKALPYITITASASQTYGSAAIFGIASILDQAGANASGLINTGSLAWFASTSAASAAGTTSAVRGAGATGTGYQILYAGNLTVGQASLSVTACDASKTYNGLAYSGGNGVAYSGFVNGETTAALGGALAYGGSAQGAINVGSYVITPSGLTSGNYTIGYVDGALTVSKAALSVIANAASKTYDGLAYNGGNGVGYSGLVNGETSAVLGGTLAYGGTSQGAVDTGNYLITPRGLISGNYAISFAGAALTVNKAPLTVTANAASKIYDGRYWSGGNGVGYSGFVNGETAAVLGGALVYSGTSQGALDVGNYLITPGGLTSGNYAIAFNDGMLDIGARVPTIPGAPVDGYIGAIASAATGIVGNASSSASVATLAVDNGDGAASSSAQGESGDFTSSAEDAAASFSSQYVLETQGCGLRLPAGLSC
jgi:filamentous hemagglutinin family protein